MTGQALTDRLEGVRSFGTGRWKAKCPAHEDRNPSLSIQESGSRILLHCFSGCEPEEIVTALGMELKDLFTDTPTPRGQPHAPKPQRLDLGDTAFRFEMAALDRKLRADAALQAVGHFNGEELTDPQRDRLMHVVARAYEDRERAEFLETVADGFRWKVCEEGRTAHAA